MSYKASGPFHCWKVSGSKWSEYKNDLHMSHRERMGETCRIEERTTHNAK